MLNAFRHHGLYRSISTEPALIPPARTCSTPFGITDYIGLRRVPPRRAEIQCSTPFGITDYIGCGKLVVHLAGRCAQRLSASRIISVTFSAALSLMRYQVLNAFRHHGLYRTRSVCCRTRLIVSAQRLSASRIISAVDGLDGLAPSGLCSTPFGITDYIGRMARYTCLFENPVQSAQRLSASRIISDDILVLDEATWSGAQRLSASRIISGPAPMSGWSKTPMVLNAFRHHGLYRPSWIRAPSCFRLGAQRLSASRIISGSVVRVVHEHRKVLNAFRHHGLYRQRGLTVSFQRVGRCSTPFGITDYIGQSTHYILRDLRAQRLSASRIISDRARCTRTTRIHGAQRLSASRIISGSFRPVR